MAEDGYVFLKELFNPDDILHLRREMLTTIQDGGWLVAGTDPLDGIADISRKCTEGDLGYTDVYHEVYKLQAFHEAGHWPNILEAMHKIVDAPVFPHPQKIARIWFPKYTDHTTPVHQDFVHFQGSFDTYTCWAPVGDCPINLGGLAVIPRSHRQGRVVDHHFSLGAGGLSIDVPQEEAAWHTTNYEAGDALLFHSLTMHKAMPNVTENQLRVSLDNRYQAMHDPIAEHMLTPHLNIAAGTTASATLSWDEVYADWTDERLQYYWTSRDGPVNPRDMSYADRGTDEAFERARHGDPHARVKLERIVRSEPTSERGLAAASILERYS